LKRQKFKYYQRLNGSVSADGARSAGTQTAGVRMPRPWAKLKEMTTSDKEFVSRQVQDVERRQLSQQLDQVL
jgi:hypothetical protein